MNNLQNNQEKILELSRGFQLSQCLFTATALGIPDLLKDGPKSCDQLAQATNSHRESLGRLLRALVIIGLVTEIAPLQFEATELATCLQQDTPGSLKDFVLLRAEQYYLCWNDLQYSIKTGKNAFEKTFGKSHYHYNQQTSELSARFDKIMGTLANRQQKAILSTYDFSNSGSIVDVGGGQGSFSIALLKQYPTLQASLFDQPESITRADKLLKEAQLTERCETVAGSFFEGGIPEGKAVYILKHVLHNWDDEHALKILQHCRQAMSPGKKLLIIEGVIAEQASERTILLDLMMLVSFASGKIRTEFELKNLLHLSGFEWKQLMMTPSDIGIVEAIAL